MDPGDGRRVADAARGARPPTSRWASGCGCSAIPTSAAAASRSREGEVEGWTGEDGAAGKDFIKTDASITHGNSGGPVVDDHGRLVGIASAFRTRVTATGARRRDRAGRPRAAAVDARATCSRSPPPAGRRARATPTSSCSRPRSRRRRGRADLHDASLDDANEAPIARRARDGAQARRQRERRSTSTGSTIRSIAWGRSNAQGEVQLKQPVPVPGTYTRDGRSRRGYEPLIGGRRSGSTRTRRPASIRGARSGSDRASSARGPEAASRAHSPRGPPGAAPGPVVRGRLPVSLTGRYGRGADSFTPAGVGPR